MHIAQSLSSGSHDSYIDPAERRAKTKTLNMFTIHYVSNEKLFEEGTDAHTGFYVGKKTTGGHQRQNQTNSHCHNIPRMPCEEHYGPAALFNTQ